ncbi:aminotransferase-like domain-containing protein [Paenibacillus xanthanilyticus]|uniref:PLP-dependent aminotransferase family protein n=1 Tax=Paenibacillus xanthanilyticus TaxID=1783531 RepID=A0ABV8KAA4_9BACL
MQYRFSERVAGMQSSVIRDMLKLAQGKDMLSFAGGLPDAKLFPVEAIREAAARALTDRAAEALQYGPTEGDRQLREWLCAQASAAGTGATPEETLLTTGSQQALDLAVRALTEPGDVVLVEDPTYLAALQLFGAYGLTVVPVASDPDGPLPDEVKRLIQAKRPRLLYAVPTFGNPTGRTWSTERRKAIVQLCAAEEIPVLEDDPYGALRFEDGEREPSLFSLAGSCKGSPVVYLGTFSKTIAPGLRTGWAMGDASVIRMMAKAKQASDLHSSIVDQRIIVHLLADFPLADYVRDVAREYGRRMNLMQRELASHRIEGLRWEEPRGGMFLWLTLPDALDAEALLRASLRQGVAFVPGAPFFAGVPERNTARLNFTGMDDERMVKGIGLFAEAINEFLARS